MVIIQLVILTVERTEKIARCPRLVLHINVSTELYYIVLSPALIILIPREKFSLCADNIFPGNSCKFITHIKTTVTNYLIRFFCRFCLSLTISLDIRHRESVCKLDWCNCNIIISLRETTVSVSKSYYLLCISRSE